MGLESGSFISALVSTNPVGATDPKSQGDDHIRFIKAKLLETFPNVTGAVTSTHLELNLVAGATEGLATLSVSYAATKQSLSVVIAAVAAIDFVSYSASVTSSDITGSIRTPVLQTTGVSAGTYTAATVVVDSKGRILSAVAGTSGITSGTAQATTSGTSIDFTSIPAGTKRITVMLSGVSTNGTSNVLVRIGDSGGIETTGYLSSTTTPDGSGISSSNYTDGFNFNTAAVPNLAANIYHGSLVLTLLNAATFTWAISGALGRSNSAGMNIVGGSKNLSAELDRISITTANGTDAFDAGIINILYE